MVLRAIEKQFPVTSQGRLFHVRGVALAVDEVHQPACYDHGACEEHKAIDPVTHHGARFAALRDAEDGGCEEREEQDSREVGGSQSHDFLPMRMLCASTAAITFSRPATTMNLVP